MRLACTILIFSGDLLEYNWQHPRAEGFRKTAWEF